MARRRIRVADFRGEPAELELPDGTVYLIRGDLPMEVVNFLADFEERSVTDTADPEQFERWLEEGRALLERLIREGSPEQHEAVLAPLSPNELLGVMGSLVGGESVGKALADALAEGIGEAMKEKSAKERAERAEDPPKPARRRAAPRKRTTTSRASTKA